MSAAPEMVTATASTSDRHRIRASTVWSLPASFRRPVALPSATPTCSTTFGNALVAEFAVPIAQTLGGGDFCEGTTHPNVMLGGTQNGFNYQLQRLNKGTGVWANMGSAFAGNGNSHSYGPQDTGK